MVQRGVFCFVGILPMWYGGDMTTRVSMSKTGRITLPADVRKAMELDGEAEFLVEELGDGEGLILRPVVLMLREDAWAYTAEHRARLKEAHEDVRAGRVRSVTEAELDELLKGRE